MDIINQIGKACPLPVVEAKKYIKSHPLTAFAVLVDNKEAVENLAKLAKEEAYTSAYTHEDDHYTVSFEANSSETVKSQENLTGKESSDEFIVVLDSERIGDDNGDFGKTLLKSFLYALSENDKTPAAVIMYNRGVFLSAGEDEDILSDLNELKEKGARVLSCGLCLDNYELKAKLKVGEVSNMYEIVSLMSKYRVVRP